jgi:ABC-type dipeptide/oligopeptide/nickel transport system permease component
VRRYALKRIFLGIITIIGVSIILFVVSRLSGDVTYLLLPENATKEDEAALRAELGLDKPIPVQFLIFVRNVTRGKFGDSIRYRRPALELVFKRLPATFELGATAFLLAICIGLPIGVISATQRNSFGDIWGKLFALIGQSMPGFWLGIMSILIFAVKLNWLPTSGRGGIAHIVLPATTLAWYSTASLVRLTRSAMLEILDSEYIKTARLKGNRERIVIWKHALRNALIPVVSLAGIQLGILLGGVVITESVFGWPGLGSLILDGVYSRDYSLVQAGVLVTSTIYITLNLIVDLLYGVIDPRIRYS